MRLEAYLLQKCARTSCHGRLGYFSQRTKAGSQVLFTKFEQPAYVKSKAKIFLSDKSYRSLSLELARLRGLRPMGREEIAGGPNPICLFGLIDVTLLSDHQTDHRLFDGRLRSEPLAHALDVVLYGVRATASVTITEGIDTIKLSWPSIRHRTPVFERHFPRRLIVKPAVRRVSRLPQRR